MIEFNYYMDWLRELTGSECPDWCLELIAETLADKDIEIRLLKDEIKSINSESNI